MTNDLSHALASAAGNGWEVTDCHGQVLQASRHRPVVSYRVSYEHAERTESVLKIVIGKAYYRGDGAGTFELMRHLWANGFSSENRLCIPEPIAWMPAEQLLLQGKATGRPLYDHLPSPEEGIARVRNAGRWLAKLHSTDVGPTSVPLPPGFEADKLTVYPDALAERHPRLGERVQAVAAAAAAVLAGDGAGAGAVVPTHGDYQPKNIYVNRRQTTVIDFDRHALAPAARDLAHFMGQCLTMSWVRTGSSASRRGTRPSWPRTAPRPVPGSRPCPPIWPGRSSRSSTTSWRSSRWPTPASPQPGSTGASSGAPGAAPATGEGLVDERSATSGSLSRAFQVGAVIVAGEPAYARRGSVLLETPPVEVTVKLYGWVSGASEVELSVPETSDLGRLLAAASPAEQALLFGRLRRHLVAELGDALSGLESSREPAASSF